MGLFKRASKEKARLRAALMGPSGSGKSYTALRLATGIGGRIAAIDTERGSLSKYASDFEFDVLDLETFSPLDYVRAIHAAEAEGYDVIIVDSLSHAWSGKGGALELVDNAAKRSKSGNTFGAWREVTPMHNQLVDALVSSRCHVIVTMRTKTEFVIENVGGRQVPRKIGMAPIQRDGVEYEFDIVLDIDHEHSAVVSKTRCSALTDKVFRFPGEDVASVIRDWLSDGAEPAPKAEKPVAKPPVATAPAEDTKLLMELSTSLNEVADEESLKRWCWRYGKQVLSLADRNKVHKEALRKGLKTRAEAVGLTYEEARAWVAEEPPSDNEAAE